MTGISYRRPSQLGSSSPSRGFTSNKLLVTLVVLFLVYVAWLRIPPRVSLLNNPEAKKALVELKNSQGARSGFWGFSLGGLGNGDHDYARSKNEIEEQVDEKEEQENQEVMERERLARLERERQVIKASEAMEEASMSLMLEEVDEAPNEIKEEEFVPLATTNPLAGLRPRTRFDLDPSDMETKYFVFQPSGGWGNQRMILRWAMRVANAMERTLIVPMVAPHNKMWYGYDRLNATDMIDADLILDMEALEAGLVKGVRVHRDHLSTLPGILPGSWRRNSKRSTMWLTENAIRSRWRAVTDRVVFWNKGSMWECCAGGTMMTPYVMFHKSLKQVSLDLAETFFKGKQYNAVHVRRGGGHTRIDRRSPQHYMELKIQPARFEPSLPIFIATDEKNKTWFDPWRDEKGFKLYFWKEVTASQQERVTTFLKTFPPRTHNDVIGFLEQLICARAKRWTGSDGSTFSFAIEGLRTFPSLTRINWQEDMSSKEKIIYAHDGKGIQTKSKESEAESAAEEQAVQLEDGPIDDDEAR